MIVYLVFLQLWLQVGTYGRGSYTYFIEKATHMIVVLNFFPPSSAQEPSKPDTGCSSSKHFCPLWCCLLWNPCKGLTSTPISGGIPEVTQLPWEEPPLSLGFVDLSNSSHRGGNYCQQTHLQSLIQILIKSLQSSSINKALFSTLQKKACVICRTDAPKNHQPRWGLNCARHYKNEQ